MTPQSRFFQVGLSAIMLRCAVFAMALIVTASPARAEVVTLICMIESGTAAGGSFTLQVDYDRKTVAKLRPDGTAYFSAPAKITEEQVHWEVVVPDMDGYKFMGSLNRLSGQGAVIFPTRFANGNMWSDNWSGPCRRATQKF